MIKLYGITMSRAARCLWALEEVGVEYELVSTDFAKGAKQPAYLKINPNGRIPAMVDGELTLFESMAINLYLARKYDNGLQPKSIEDQARAEQWSFWGMMEIEGHLIQMLLNRLMRPEDQRDEAVAKNAATQLDKPLAVLDAALSDRSHLLGEAFTIADLNVASILSMGQLVGLDISKFKAVSRWMTTCTARPALARAQQR